MTLLQQTIIHERKMIKMLGDNLKKLRQSRGLSQEEMAGKLNVVRQTVSKWEKGLSVPDSEMLMEIARQFEIPVSTLLGETPGLEDEASDMRIVLEKLTLINEQLARSAQAKRRALRAVCIAVIAIVGLYMAFLLVLGIYMASGANVSVSGDSIGIIGGADGPTTVFVTTQFGHPLTLIVMVIALIAAVAGWFIQERSKKLTVCRDNLPADGLIYLKTVRLMQPFRLKIQFK